VLIDAASAYHTARCRDVSPGGLGLELRAELSLGTTVDLYFELPTGVAIEVRAEVVHKGNDFVGLRFKGLRAEEQRALAAYCEAWRGELLQRCARRAESMNDIRVDLTAQAAVGSMPYDSSEAESGVRIRVANPIG
jgi:predicted Zn-dependent protease